MKARPIFYIMQRRSLFNMHFTTTISVSLVLFLIGLECVVLMSARELMRHVRENVALTIVLKDDVTTDEIHRMKVLMNADTVRRLKIRCAR